MKNERFEEYFLKYKNLIIRLVMLKLDDYQVAQEICQQVYVALYTNMDKVHPDLVKAWLIRCTQNAVIDYVRRRKVKREIFTDAPVAESGNILMEESVELLAKKLDDRELTGRILREVKEVNTLWFEALMLCCVEGLSYEEASEKLNVPVDVLRARMYRARAYIRKKFGDEYPEK